MNGIQISVLIVGLRPVALTPYLIEKKVIKTKTKKYWSPRGGVGSMGDATWLPVWRLGFGSLVEENLAET